MHGIDIDNHDLNNGGITNDSIFYDGHKRDSYNIDENKNVKK